MPDNSDALANASLAAHPPRESHLRSLAKMDENDDIPHYANAGAEEVAAFWAKTASRLLGQVAEMKACAMECERARLAGDMMTAQLHASVLVQLALKGGG